MKFLCFDTALNGTYTLLHLQKEYPTHRCLFQGTKDENIWDVTPWLFAINSFDFSRVGEDSLCSLKEYIVFETNDTIEDLCDHLQKFIYKIEGDREVYNRFWDARVLQRTLPEYSNARLASFFEFIDAVYVLASDNISYQRINVGNKGQVNIENIKSNLMWGKDATEDKVVEEQPKKRRFFLD